MGLELLELCIVNGAFEQQELITRKVLELIEACDPKRVRRTQLRSQLMRWQQAIRIPDC